MSVPSPETSSDQWWSQGVSLDGVSGYTGPPHSCHAKGEADQYGV